MAKTVQEFRAELRFRRRLYFFTFMIFFLTLCFTLQLGSLQLVNGYENRVLAKKFVSHQEFTVAPRGLFYDRHSRLGDQPLVQNLRFIDFVIHPDQFESRKEAQEYVQVFSSIMGRDYENYRPYFKPARWKQILRKNEFITLLTRMTRREHERLAAFHLPAHKGEYVTKHMRYYTMGPALAHVSGFIGLPSSTELRKKLAQSYQTIGKDGLEARYDSRLRGRDGVRVRHRTLDQEEQISTTEQGDNLILTIDRKIQAAAYRTLAASSQRGTVIAMRANTGEILALASHPSFDPNILSSGNAGQRKVHIQQIRRHKAFLNLATLAKFPPASTFKPLLALAALENTDSNKTFTPDTSFQCPGRFILRSSYKGLPSTSFRCWSVHGSENMIDAIMNSCNVYFYNLGYQLGPTAIIQYSRAFGLDKPTGVDLLGEIAGFVPDPRWKQRNFSSRWYDGDTINLAIGQGFLQTTPLQIAVLYSAIANRGAIYQPYLVKEIRDPIDNHIIKEFKPRLLRSIPLSSQSVKIVQEGMRRVITQGTARRLGHIALPIAGKTGTVQTRSKRKSRDHAWFASFAPYGAPLDEIIIVVVFVEYGLAGAATAAPIALEVYKAAFPDWNRKKTRELLKQQNLQKILEEERSKEQIQNYPPKEDFQQKQKQNEIIEKETEQKEGLEQSIPQVKDRPGMYLRPRPRARESEILPSI